LGAGAVLAGVYMATGFGIPCGLRTLTGVLCPFCGGTHMAAALLHLDLAGAWQANAACLVFGVLLGVRTLGWLVEWRRHPEYGTRWLPAWVSKNGLIIAGILALVWAVVRNIWF
jgi:hypothetical protein